jgi:hypothetical protein
LQFGIRDYLTFGLSTVLTIAQFTSAARQAGLERAPERNAA